MVVIIMVLCSGDARVVMKAVVLYIHPCGELTLKN